MPHLDVASTTEVMLHLSWLVEQWSNMGQDLLKSTGQAEKGQWQEHFEIWRRHHLNFVTSLSGIEQANLSLTKKLQMKYTSTDCIYGPTSYSLLVLKQ